MKDFEYLFEVVCAKPYRFKDGIASDSFRLIREDTDFIDNDGITNQKIIKAFRKETDQSARSRRVFEDLDGLLPDSEKIVFNTVPDVSSIDVLDFEDAVPPFENFFIEFPENPIGEIECFHITAYVHDSDYEELGADMPFVDLVATRFGYFQETKTYLGPCVVFSMRIGTDGKVIEYVGPRPMDQVFTDLKELWANRLAEINKDYAKRILYVFSMINCQNISVVPGGFADDGVGKKRRRKDRRPHIEYKVLKVQTGKHKFQILGRATSGENANVPLHVVRGHFATYTEDRPMFGRPGEFGRYWVPSHTRGKKGNGEIRKTYSVDNRKAGVA